jgi:hypothetical protein
MTLGTYHRNRSETVPRRRLNREALEPRPTKQRSAVTNGKRLFVEGSGRSPWSRRFYDCVSLHVADMGGRANLGEGQLALIKRASALQCELELMEGKLSLGEPVDLDVFQRCSSSLRRLLESLGLHKGRIPREVNGTLDGGDDVLELYRAHLHNGDGS